MASFQPQQGAATSIVTGGTPVTAINAVSTGIGGGYITNPLLAVDQGLVTAEPLYVNIVGPAALTANITTIALQPGQSWNVPPGQNTATSVNAATSGHKFTAVWWNPAA